MCLISKSFQGYLHKSLNDDMANIERHYQSNSKRNFWVAVNQDQSIVGIVGVQETSRKGVAELRRMSSRSDYRGKGVAQALLSTLEQFCREQGYNRLYLETMSLNRAAIKFYTKSGFKRVQDSHIHKSSKYFPFDFPCYEKPI